MARTGVEKSDVERARASLLAQGLYPSIDAVRAALGNTGSKSTIHRYLKELEETEPASSKPKTGVSELILQLVQQLNAQLQAEADARIQEANARHQEDTARWQSELQTLQQQTSDVSMKLAQRQAELADLTVRHEDALMRLSVLEKDNIRLSQENHGLQRQLQVEAEHRASLEDKHEHARVALEHFRQAAKEQREQEQLRHSEQIQQLQAEVRLARQTLVIKQDDLTRLHQDNTRQAAELQHLLKQLEQTETALMQTEQKAVALQQVEQQYRQLQVVLAAKDEQLIERDTHLAKAVSEQQALQRQLQQQELSLAVAQAKLAEHDKWLEMWRQKAEVASANQETEPESSAAEPILSVDDTSTNRPSQKPSDSQ